MRCTVRCFGSTEKGDRIQPCVIRGGEPEKASWRRRHPGRLRKDPDSTIVYGMSARHLSSNPPALLCAYVFKPWYGGISVPTRPIRDLRFKEQSW